MRLFLAADLDAGVRREIAELARELPSLTRRARWVRPEELHLTLRFFGEVPVEEVESLGDRLREALSGLPAFSLELRGCGVFPERGRPRVLWVPVVRPPEALFELQTRAEECARAMGFPPETRRFEPHVTIARFRERERDTDSIAAAFASRSFGVSPVCEAILFESRLSSPGARHERRRVFPLASSPGRVG